MAAVSVLICVFQADIKKERRRPTVKFRDMVRELEDSACAKADSSMKVVADNISEDETTSDVEMEDDCTTHSISVPEADAFTVDGDIDLDLRFLLDMLSAEGSVQLEVPNDGLEGTRATRGEREMRSPTGTFEATCFSPVFSFSPC